MLHVNKLILATICLFALQMRAEDPCGGSKFLWGACLKDDDCVVHANMCGFPAAYNKKYIEQIERYNKCMGPMISCATHTENNDKNKMRAVCKKINCALQEINK